MLMTELRSEPACDDLMASPRLSELLRRLASANTKQQSIRSQVRLALPDVRSCPGGNGTFCTRPVTMLRNLQPEDVSYL